jgi:hypothetical protein
MNNVQSPRTDDAGMEARLAAQSTAPRVTLADLKAQIASVHYINPRDAVDAAAGGGQTWPESLGLLTICVLVLKNGFTVTGESACASPESFDPLIGRQIAYNHALDKMWPLLGYQLKDAIYHGAVLRAK